MEIELSKLDKIEALGYKGTNIDTFCGLRILYKDNRVCFMSEKGTMVIEVDKLNNDKIDLKIGQIRDKIECYSITYNDKGIVAILKTAGIAIASENNKVTMVSLDGVIYEERKGSYVIYDSIGEKGVFIELTDSKKMLYTLSPRTAKLGITTDGFIATMTEDEATAAIEIIDKCESGKVFNGCNYRMLDGTTINEASKFIKI